MDRGAAQISMHYIDIAQQRPSMVRTVLLSLASSSSSAAVTWHSAKLPSCTAS